MPDINVDGIVTWLEDWFYTKTEVDSLIEGGSGGSSFILYFDESTGKLVYTDEEMFVTCKKIWDDNGNNLGRRPTQLRVTLSNGSTHYLTSANDWSVSVKVPKEVDGVEQTYDWTEQTVLGYTQTSKTLDGNVTTFTNKFSGGSAPPLPGLPDEEIPE